MPPPVSRMTPSMAEQEPLLPAHGSQPNSAGRTGATLTWRAKTSHVLESRGLHKTVITLITIDAACVLADLGYTFLSPGCAPTNPEAPIWLEALAHISLAITSLFLIEIPLAVWAFGIRYYNPFGQVTHAGLHLFDALIIVTTFVLEVALRGRERELASLLIILRLWRLVKLVGGVAVGAGEIEEAVAEELEETRAELRQAKADLRVSRDENDALRQRIAVFQGSS